MTATGVLQAWVHRVGEPTGKAKLAGALGLVGLLLPIVATTDITGFEYDWVTLWRITAWSQADPTVVLGVTGLIIAGSLGLLLGGVTRSHKLVLGGTVLQAAGVGVLGYLVWSGYFDPFIYRWRVTLGVGGFVLIFAPVIGLIALFETRVTDPVVRWRSKGVLAGGCGLLGLALPIMSINYRLYSPFGWGGVTWWKMAEWPHLDPTILYVLVGTVAVGSLVLIAGAVTRNVAILRVGAGVQTVGVGALGYGFWYHHFPPFEVGKYVDPTIGWFFLLAALLLGVLALTEAWITDRAPS